MSLTSLITIQPCIWHLYNFKTELSYREIIARVSLYNQDSEVVVTCLDSPMEQIWKSYSIFIAASPPSTCTWKPTSEIWVMRAYSNHHQLFLEAWIKWGMKPAQKMSISQSLPSKSTGNTCRKGVLGKPCHLKTHSTEIPAPLQRGVLYSI